MWKMPRIPLPSTLAALIAVGEGIEHIVKELHELKEQAMSDKAEVLAQVADVKALVVELTKDVGRVLDRLDAAIAAGNMDEVSAAVADLRSAVQDVDDRVEAAAPEPVEEPASEEPTDGEPVEPAP